LRRRKSMKLVNGVIVLSRRNLLALLGKLEEPHSLRTICKTVQDGEEIRDIMVRAEEDEPHYNGETPGVMAPSTEAFIQAHQR
jgi:hypothetical protein